MGYSPWDCKNTTEDKEKDHLHFFILNHHCQKKSQGSILINILDQMFPFQFSVVQ